MALVVLFAAPDALAAPVTLDFESGATVGQQVTNQYGSPGMPAGPTFEPGSDAGFTGLGCGPPSLGNSGPAHSGSRSLKLDGCAGGEFWPTATFFALGYSTKAIAVWVAVPGSIPSYASESVVATAFDANRSIVEQTTTTLGPQASATWHQVQLGSGGGDIAYVAIELGSTNPHNTSSATGVTLSVGNTYLYVDDLTYDPPSSPPSSSFLLGANPIAEQVSLGQSGTVKIPITWTNNPNPSGSPVSLELNGLPSGVSGSFSPNPSSTGNSTLTLAVDKSATPGNYQITVDGYVDKGTTSQKHAGIAIPFTIAPAFAINPIGSVAVAGCTPHQVQIELQTDPNLSDPLTVGVSLGAQSPVTISSISGGKLIDSHDATATVSQKGGVATVTVTLTLASGAPLAAPANMVVTASAPGYAIQATSISVATESGKVSQVALTGTSTAPGTVSTPQLGFLGTILTLEGEGFCPGTRVAVGYYDSSPTNPDFSAIADSVASDGRSLEFKIPPGATTGWIRVERSDGHNFLGPVLTVNSFRNTVGFNWANNDFDSYMNASEVDDLFGKNETNINVFGWLVRKPEANFFEQIVNKYVRGGVCFGMVDGGEEMSAFPGERSGFPHTGGSDQWHLNSPTMPSPSLLGYIIERFSLQFTDQLIPLEEGQLLGQATVAHSASADVDEINAEIAAHHPVLIGLVHWDGLKLDGHSVLAYRTEPLAGGATAVDVYNPNIPYRTTEEGAAGVHDTAQFTNSRITIDANGHWTFPQLTASDGRAWNGPDANLIIYKQSDLPIINGHAPKLPNVFTSLGLVVFGAAGDGALQVTDDHGGEIFRAGQLAPAIQWPRGVAPLPDFSSRARGLQILAVDPRHASTLRAIVSRGSGGGAMSFSLPGLQASLQAGVRAGQLDHLTIDPHADSISYQTSRSGTRLSGTLLSSPAARGASASAAGQSALGDRVVQFTSTASSGGSDQLSFPGGGSFVVRHTGAPTTLAVRLSAFAPDGQPESVDLGTVRLGRSDALRVAPTNWKALGSSQVRLVLARGHRNVTRLRIGRRLGVRFVTVKRVALQAIGARRYRLKLALGLTHVPAGSWLSVAAALTRGNHVVAQTVPAQFSGSSLGRSGLALSLRSRIASGRYNVAIRLLEATASGSLQGSVVVSTTATLTARKR